MKYPFIILNPEIIVILIYVWPLFEIAIYV